MTDTTKNVTTKIAKRILASFESKRVLSKNVNTQMLDGKFNPSTGSKTLFKRPTDFTSTRSATGDVSGVNSEIVVGNAEGNVQDYITVKTDYDEAIEALEFDGDENSYFDNMGQRIVTDLELDYAGFMMKNAALQAGTVGTAAGDWDAIADAGAIMQSTGVPMGKWCYGVNPFTQKALASEKRGLAVSGDFRTANQQAVIDENYAGMRVMTATTLSNYQTSAGTDRVGALSANVDATYSTAKDSMQQDLVVSGFEANLVIKAGERVSIAGSNRLNQSTRQLILDQNGSPILFTATVVADVTLSGTGTGTIVVTGPAVQEASGAYNTVDVAPLSGAVVTLLAAESAIIQPNMFWHKDAFSIGSVPMKRLHSTDTFAMTSDGLQLRVSKYSNGDANSQTVRIDLRPAFAVLNPFWAGHGHG